MLSFPDGFLLLIPLFWIIVGCSVTEAADEAKSSSSSSSFSHPGQQQPNIVFLVVESTDGRTWQRGYQNDVIPLPNLRKLEDRGATSFYRHYCNTPVCCPSRASFWSGKHPHKIPHNQSQIPSTPSSPPYLVNGVWNNFEGLPEQYAQTMFDVLQANGYTTWISGKEDYVTGGHSLSVRMNAWTMYADLPYNLTDHNPWAGENAVCREDGTVTPTDPLTPHESASHKGDWKDLNETINWIRDYHQGNNNTTTNNNKPFFVYQGMNIVHPPYHTSEYWLHQIDNVKIQVPAWPESLNELHPCDVHMSMIKGCLPISEQDIDHTRSIERRREIRRIYYAMIAEFDAMVGRYMDTIDELGLSSNTVFVVTSDHGDMQMEHAQFYKMSPYDASSSVPLIIYDPRRVAAAVVDENEASTTTTNNQVIRDVPTQHIDLFPTMLELAGISSTTTSSSHNPSIPKDLDGYSLVPFLDPSYSKGIKTRIFRSDASTSTLSSRHLRAADATGDDKTNVYDNKERPLFVVVQYHGDDSPMSWFVIVQTFPCMERRKSSAAGDGSEHRHYDDESSQQTKNYHRAASLSDDGDSSSSSCMHKLILWGTGEQVDSQLFDLTNDPDETTNLIHDPDYELITGMLHSNLQSVVDYRAVAMDVANYNRESFVRWKDQNPSNWTDILNSTSLRWHPSWERNAEGALAAIQEWLKNNDDDNDNPAPLQGCRREMAWPPKKEGEY